MRLSVCKLVFLIKVTSLILQEEFQFINLETFTLRLHATKRQKLYTKYLAKMIQIYSCTCRYNANTGQRVCLVCNSGFLCVLCHPYFFVTMYITFYRVINSPPTPPLLSVGKWNMIIALQVLLVGFFSLKNYYKYIKKLQNNIFLVRYLSS